MAANGSIELQCTPGLMVPGWWEAERSPMSPRSRLSVVVDQDHLEHVY
jgi:hypothetical protein